MGEIECRFWEQLVKKSLASKPGGALDKGAQQALALALQEWTANCIAEHLRVIVEEKGRKDLIGKLRKDVWRINWKGKDFLGGVRWQEVDVWMANNVAGLALAVDPKHFQSRKSLGKNWKNGFNDLVAFATNLHERFPLCAVGGVIGFAEKTAAPSNLQQMHGICCRAIPRERSANALGKFEGFGLAVYSDTGDLTWPFEAKSPLKPEAAFTSLAKAVYLRTIALL